MLNKIILIFLVLFLVSCTKEIEVDIPVQKPSMVVYSTIVPFTTPQPKSLNIDLQSTRHIYDSAGYPISDATLLLFKNNILFDTVKYIDSVNCYPLNGLFPKEGDNYTIIINHAEFETIFAYTFIPTKVYITDTVITPVAYFDETGSVFSEISITFTDPGDEINYYELAVSDISFSYDNPDDFYELSTNDNIITSESYYPSLIRFDVDKPKYLLFTDKQINGVEHTLNVYYTPPQREDENRYISSHYISIHLRNVTEDYYKFKTSMIQHLYNKQEDILYGMGEPLNVISNIENGYGLFSGFNNDIVSLYVDEQIIN